MCQVRKLEHNNLYSCSKNNERLFNGHILVQNAGFAYGPRAPEPFADQAVETLKINFWGTLNMMKAFFPLIRPNGRVVNVSSMLSMSAQLGFERILY